MITLSVLNSVINIKIDPLCLVILRLLAQDQSKDALGALGQCTAACIRAALKAAGDFSTMDSDHGQSIQARLSNRIYLIILK